MNIERKSVAGFEGYFISPLGDVFSARRSGKFLKQHTKWRGHHATVTVYIRETSGKWKRMRVSHLVLGAFGPPRPKGHGARHLDGNGTNNSADNLAWGTQAENIADAIRHGTAPRARGEKNTKAKLTESDVHNIRSELRNGRHRRELATQYGIHISSITFIANRRSWAWLPEVLP